MNQPSVSDKGTQNNVLNEDFKMQRKCHNFLHESKLLEYCYTRALIKR